MCKIDFIFCRPVYICIRLPSKRAFHWFKHHAPYIIDNSNMSSVIYSIPIRSWRLLIPSRILRCQKCSKSDDRYSDPSHPEFSNSYSPPEIDVDAIRNVSRLPRHLINRRSRKAPENIDDFTMKFKRKIYMYYGTESGLEPGIMWPTASEIQERIDYQRNWEPTLEEMVEEVNERKERRNEGRMKRY